MPSFDCDKCHEGTLEFEIDTADSGDGVWLQTFTTVWLAEQACRCEYTEAELRKLEDAAIEAEEISIADAQVNSLLAAHGL